MRRGGNPGSDGFMGVHGPLSPSLPGLVRLRPLRKRPAVRRGATQARLTAARVIVTAILARGLAGGHLNAKLLPNKWRLCLIYWLILTQGELRMKQRGVLA
jgi:hypothetical protein